MNKPLKVQATVFRPPLNQTGQGRASFSQIRQLSIIWHHKQALSGTKASHTVQPDALRVDWWPLPEHQNRRLKVASIKRGNTAHCPLARLGTTEDRGPDYSAYLLRKGR